MRRRRSRGTWFPTIGTSILESPVADDTVSGRQFNLALGVGVTGITTVITPITQDEPQEGELGGSGQGLADIIGSEYILQRIVGKCYIERTVTLNSLFRDTNPAVLVGAGFFVARANDFSLNPDLPVGSATEAERSSNFSPLEQDTMREPWVWRRVWILGSAGRAPLANDLALANDVQTINTSAANYPSSTALYGSVADGPHIDSRVKRRVSQDDRLWFAVSVCTFPVNVPTQTEPVNMIGYLDYRLFGSLRKAKNSSAF